MSQEEWELCRDILAMNGVATKRENGKKGHFMVGSKAEALNKLLL